MIVKLRVIFANVVGLTALVSRLLPINHQLNEQINCRIVFVSHRNVHLSGQQSGQASVLNFDNDQTGNRCKNGDGMVAGSLKI